MKVSWLVRTPTEIFMAWEFTIIFSTLKCLRCSVHSKTLSPSQPFSRYSLQLTLIFCSTACLVFQSEDASTDLPDQCDGFRCSLGQCISQDRVCDRYQHPLTTLRSLNMILCRHWDCVEGEDEAACPMVAAPSLALCSRQPQEPGLCWCPAGTRRCDNNLCLPADQVTRLSSDLH